MKQTVKSFDNTDKINWKQSSDVHVNDIIYLYVTNQYSKIIYKCKAIEVNIPYEYKDKNIFMNRIMKIILLKKLDNKGILLDI